MITEIMINAFAFAAGDIGIEYNFDIPLLISLDLDQNLVMDIMIIIMVQILFGS
jgi:hypothetical protein